MIRAALTLAGWAFCLAGMCALIGVVTQAF